jgi:MoxR-like ATPase
MTDWEIFKGTGQPHNGLDRLPEPPGWRTFRDESMHQQQKATTFKVRDEQKQLVNAALYLRRPLLITGKPGTGKTSLAYAIAYELGLGEVLYWPITTRTTLKQGLYSYDAIGRLQDDQFRQRMRASGEDGSGECEPTDIAGELRTIGKYIRLGPLGTALLPMPEARLKRPRILLIDEIDKSDIDLPNDLLHTFEEGRFRIDELERIKASCPDVVVSTAYTQTDGSVGAAKEKLEDELEAGQISEQPKWQGEVAATIINGQVQCNTFPLVILTSNGERDFPPPFLRRCIRLDMDPPTPEELAEIVKSHLTALDPDVLTKAQPIIKAFVDKRLRETLATDQLLNAIYLLLQKGNPLDEPGLLDKILKPLSGPGA